VMHMIDGVADAVPLGISTGDVPEGPPPEGRRVVLFATRMLTVGWG
jgi:hypothetical protein